MMASLEDQPTPVFNDVDDFDDEDDDTDPDPLTADAVAVDSSSSDTEDNSTAAVTVAIPSSIAAPSSASGVTIALPDPKRHRFDTTSSPAIEKKPIDDSRRLFQRLWTDEDEIELLQGFLDFSHTRGTTSSGHHLDTAAFYDQIRSKLQLDFNKNQLVEKLRRLKKKYRTIISKMSSGKDFVFKTPHDQATFEISKKIWSNVPPNHPPPVEFDDEDQNFGHNPNPIPNPIPNPSPIFVAAMTTPPPNSSSYVMSHINLNTAATPIERKPTNYDLMMGSMAAANAAKLSSRKRPRIGKLEDKFVRVDLVGSASPNANTNAAANANVNANSNNVSNNNSNPVGNNVHVGSTIQGLIEETVRNCFSPMFKDLVNNAVNGAGVGGGGGGVRGVGALAMNAIPLSFPGVNLGSNGGEVMDERWRKQQILELEVYSKRLELVQDQIKLTLEELRSTGALN